MFACIFIILNGPLVQHEHYFFLFSSNSFPFWHRLSSFEDERGFESIETPATGANSQQEMMPLLRQANQCTVGPSYGATRTRRKPLQNFVEHKVTIQSFHILQSFSIFLRFLGFSPRFIDQNRHQIRHKYRGHQIGQWTFQ